MNNNLLGAQSKRPRKSDVGASIVGKAAQALLLSLAVAILALAMLWVAVWLALQVLVML